VLIPAPILCPAAALAWSQAAVLVRLKRTGCRAGKKIVCTLVSSPIEEGQRATPKEKRNNVILYNADFILYCFLDRNFGKVSSAFAFLPGCVSWMCMVGMSALLLDALKSLRKFHQGTLR
jgi:hypothetical protein